MGEGAYFFDDLQTLGRLAARRSLNSFRALPGELPRDANRSRAQNLLILQSTIAWSRRGVPGLDCVAAYRIHILLRFPY
jgi:hypothetical protein